MNLPAAMLRRYFTPGRLFLSLECEGRLVGVPMPVGSWVLAGGSASGQASFVLGSFTRVDAVVLLEDGEVVQRDRLEQPVSLPAKSKYAYTLTVEASGG